LQAFGISATEKPTGFSADRLKCAIRDRIDLLQTASGARGGSVLASCAIIGLVDLLQLVVPEQLPIAVVEQDVEGDVGGVSSTKEGRWLLVSSSNARS
jgi:hypothetical protein